jgi:tRNA threonylcarbamoyladenosine biosynthesis protein TsaE
MEKIHVKNLLVLEAFARQFAASLKGGDVVGLVGDLGAGKTTFVQLLSKALGVKKEVKSPTFILMQLLETDATATKRGVAKLCHVDAYRLKDFAELQSIGFEEYAGASDVVTLVEWADRVPELHEASKYRELTFVFDEGEGRIINLGE